MAIYIVLYVSKYKSSVGFGWVASAASPIDKKLRLIFFTLSKELKERLEQEEWNSTTITFGKPRCLDEI